MTKAAIGRRALRIGKWLLIAILLLIILAAVWFGWVLHATKPQLEGQVEAAGLSAPVSIARDAGGVPVITGATRKDVAFALGYLHGQERFFQMDTLRRLAAGELADLFGGAALDTDKRIRLHRFRARDRKRCSRILLSVSSAAPPNRSASSPAASRRNVSIWKNRSWPWR